MGGSAGTAPGSAENADVPQVTVESARVSVILQLRRTKTGLWDPTESSSGILFYGSGANTGPSLLMGCDRSLTYVPGQAVFDGAPGEQA